jgi:hypothetical protein
MSKNVIFAQSVPDSPRVKLIKIGKLVMVFASLLSGLIQANNLQKIYTKWAPDKLHVDYLLIQLTVGLPETLHYSFLQ